MARRKKKHYSFEEKSLVVQKALESELTLKELDSMFSIHFSTISSWLKKINHNLDNIDQLKPKRKAKASEEHKQATQEDLPEWIQKEINKLLKDQPSWGALKFKEYFFRHHQELLSERRIYFYLKETGVIEKRRKARIKGERAPHERRFEFEAPLAAAQCDLLQMTLAGGEKIYLITFIDDYSRFILSSSFVPVKTMDHVIKNFVAMVRNHGVIERLITDKGSEFVNWNSFSRFEQTLLDWDVELIASGPDRPQCQGKIERWHKTLREDFEDVYGPFTTLVEAQIALDNFNTFYNYERPNEAIKGLVPADRFYGVSDELLKAFSHCRKKDERIYFTCNIGGNKLVVCGPRQGNVKVFLNGKEEISNDSKASGSQ